MTDPTAASYDDFKRDVVYDASVTKIGVYEVWWNANARYPEWPLSKRLAVAEHLVSDLVADHQIQLFRGNWIGPNDGEPIAAVDLPVVLRRWDTWVPQDGEDLVWLRDTDPSSTATPDSSQASPHSD